ncbi:PspC domain-containing protein [Roseimarinus sediminis]|uniref:PspC domain-containing protein n=1 Tax=Roseimarinus sediminis TaxID=1610899 RepID=UPI003D24B1FF
MKKTLTINISGIVFHIDDDAYEKLKDYLSRVSQHFSKEEGGHEIISDIEARIAELFSERTSGGSGVINKRLVDQVIETMGMPEDFPGGDDEAPKEPTADTKQHSERHYYTQRKKLYRDPETRVFGGVCGGLAYYFGMERWIVRLLFVILAIATSGIALPVYLVLWIAVPKAYSTTQRLEMKGEPINVENIGRSVKEEFSEMKDNFGKYKNSKEYQKAREYTRRTGETVEAAGRGTVSVFSRIFGFIFLVTGFLMLAGLMFGIFTSSKIAGVLPGFHSGIFLDHVFSGSMATTLLLAVLIIVGMPILLLIYLGTKMLFNYVANSRSVLLTALGVWVIGIIVAIGSGAGAIDVFSTSTSVSNEKELNIPGDTLWLEMNEDLYERYESRMQVNNFKILVVDGEERLVGKPRFTIRESNNEAVELKVRSSSKGNNFKNALHNAGEINYQYQLEGNTLLFDPWFFIEEGGKWRDQKTIIELKLPVGKVVYLNDNLLPIIHDIKNTTNTWDGDMTSRYWEMKADGLTLVDK